MSELSVIEIPASSIGPCGITLGIEPDPGGGPEPVALMIPLVRVDWLDERQVCAHVQAYLHGADAGQIPTYQTCGSFRTGGRCALAGNTACAFLDLDGEVWRKAHHWRPYHDGVLYVGEKTEAEIAALTAGIDADA